MGTVHDYLSEIVEVMHCLPIMHVEKVIDTLHEARTSRRQVFIMGNGGSAATATHFVCDLLKNTRVQGFPNFRCIGLSDNMAVFSALANDEGYTSVFSQQLAGLVQPQDIVIGISTSGNSANVLEAIALANQVGAITIGFTGQDGGKLGQMVEMNVMVPNHRADQTEDIHMILSHTITASLREMAKSSLVAVNKKTAPTYLNKADMAVLSNGGSNGKPQIIWHGNGNGQSDPVLKIIDSISVDPTQIYDSPETLTQVLNIIIESLEATSGSFVILDDQHEIANSSLVYRGQVQPVDPTHMKRFIKSGLAGWVVQNQKSALLVSTRKDRRWIEHAQMNLQGPARSVICAPLLLEEQVFGVITLSRPDTNAYSVKDLLILTGIIAAITFHIKSRPVSR